MKPQPKIPVRLLYVEDETDIREAVSLFLGILCDFVVCAPNGSAGLELARLHRPHIVVTDIRMPVMDGIEFVTRLRQEMPEVPVVFTTAYSEVPYLLKAIELGATGFVRKPIDYPELEKVLRRLSVPVVQQAEIEKLRKKRGEGLAHFMGGAPCLEALTDKILNAIDNHNPLVITGESGTGKLHLARLAHSCGARSHRPCVVVRCAESAPGKLEEELLGGTRRGTGRLAAATGGTLILAGLEEMPPTLQSKLATIVSTGSFTPAGQNAQQSFSARIIATVKTGRKQSLPANLNRDLHVVISEQTLNIPSVRHYENIGDYALRFLIEAADEQYREIPVIEPDAMALLKKHPWPGNMRELRWVMRNALLENRYGIAAASVGRLLERFSNSDTHYVTQPPTSLLLDELEQWALKEALARTGGLKMQAAELLGIDYKRFKRKLALYSISDPIL